MKYYLIPFAIGLLLGIFLGFVYCTSSLGNNQPSVLVPSPKELKKEVVQFETGYSKSFDTLKKESDNLRSELTDTKSQLQRAKQRSQVLQGQVYSLLDNRLERKQTDTIATTTSCDTLSTTVVELMQAAAQKDTLYEQVTSNLEEQLKNKDTTIALKDSQYTDLKTTFDKSVDSQQLLADQNKLLNKEYKRQKIKGKLLSAILFAVSGAAATYFIHH